MMEPVGNFEKIDENLKLTSKNCEERILRRILMMKKKKLSKLVKFITVIFKIFKFQTFEKCQLWDLLLT